MKKAGPIVLGLLALSVGCGREAAESYVELPGGLRGAVHPNENDRLSATTDAPVVRIELPSEDAALPSTLAPLAGVVPDPAQQRQLTSAIASGVLECGPGRVWAGYSILGEVHAFDEDSRLAWIVRLTDFRRPGYLFRWDEAGRAAGMDIEPGAFDSGYFDESLDRISLLSEHVLAIQVTRVERGTDQEGFPETLTYRTYLLDPENGHFLGGFTADHQILGGGNGMAILYRERPSPRVSVVRIEG